MYTETDVGNLVAVCSQHGDSRCCSLLKGDDQSIQQTCRERYTCSIKGISACSSALGGLNTVMSTITRTAGWFVWPSECPNGAWQVPPGNLPSGQLSLSRGISMNDTVFDNCYIILLGYASPNFVDLQRRSA
jgi:hypothetical protein